MRSVPGLKMFIAEMLRDTHDYVHIYFCLLSAVGHGKFLFQIKLLQSDVVVEREVFREFKGDIKAYFNHYAKSNVALAKAMENATQIRDFNTEGDYSYSISEFVGNGFLLVGDAARFVDPIFSSGSA